MMTTGQVQGEAPMTFEQIREMFQEIGRKQEETDRQISRLGSRLGDLIEHLTASNILDKFNDEGYQFTQISRNHTLKDTKNMVIAEIDILLENGNYAMVVEVKTNLTKSDIKDHLKRMETLRRYADARGDKRKFVSSVAGALIDDGAREYALAQGLYVIEHPGQTVEIVAPPKKREW
ncbi:hypothetical protein AGMMS49940_15620 [Spirochaetia bacterium]|nr:hypothetical protein AGMMS49940_15620 [Spirochaetia bacterium]